MSNTASRDVETYDLAVIGAGTGGLVAAFLAASLGAKTALIERERVGGECLWTGCVPSKTLIKSARVYETMKRAAEFGVHVEAPRLIWPAVRMRIAAVRDEIRDLERAELKKANITVINGTAQFTDPHTLQLTTKAGTQTLRAKKFILATGTKPHIPDLEGLAEGNYLTHQQVYDLPSLPRSMVILGGGPIGCEFAHAFARFGTKVTLLQQGQRLLPKEDEEISAACQQLLQQAGVQVYLQATARRVRVEEMSQQLEFETSDGTRQNVRATHLLIATGKEVDTSSLNLVAAGVRADSHRIITDAYLRTTAPHIWACGDVTGQYLFTHVAEYQGKLAAQNALLPLKTKADYRVVPWVTFTDPEIAHLGLTQQEAERAGPCQVYRLPFSQLDRAIIEGETEGFLKVITSPSGRILGAHIIGPQAGELIHNFVPAVRDGALIQEMAETIHAYPTLSEIGHRAGNEYYRELLHSKWLQQLLHLAHVSI